MTPPKTENRRQRRGRLREIKRNRSLLRTPIQLRHEQIKVDCPQCNGTGKVTVQASTIIITTKGTTTQERCPTCDGQKFMWLSRHPVT